MKRLIFLSVAMLAVPAVASAAGPRQAACSVKTSGAAPYQGPCRFLAEEKGSFSLEPIGRRSFPGEVSSISLSIISPGVAEVRGLTRDGINSRWGEARRSTKQKACWAGSDFTLCVR